MRTRSPTCQYNCPCREGGRSERPAHREGTTPAAPRPPARSRASPSGRAGPCTGPATRLRSGSPAARGRGRRAAAGCARSLRVSPPAPPSETRTVGACRVAPFFRKASAFSLQFKSRGLAQSPPLKSFPASSGSLGSKERRTACPGASAGGPSRSGAFAFLPPFLAPSLSLFPSFLLCFPRPLLPLKFPAP